MKNSILLSTFLSLFAITGFGQLPIQYQVNLDEIHHHELRISVSFEALGEKPLTLQMPNSSPGRYAWHNFAKNVYDTEATNSQGQLLPVYRVSPSSWEVGGHDGQVTFSYTLYGNHGDGTYTGIDRKKLHMNMPATFVYGVGMEERPIEISFDLNQHPDWSVATQLKKINNQTFYAPNYAYFFDSPTMIGDIDFRRWEVPGGGTSQIIEVAMLHEGTDQELDAYVQMVKAVVSEQREVFGSLPKFDFGKYTFLCSYNPWIFGDGMEHRNSTVCSSSSSLATNANGLIRTISHEFFHAWNVERIRPASLEPFDFSKANMSGELWFAEGFTSYYDDYILARVGILTPEAFISGNTGMFNYVLNSPGRQLRSPIEMSHYAPFTDAATAIDEDNEANTFVSYYSYGAVLGFALDLSLRKEFSGITLDDYMHALWKQYGSSEIPYEVPDLEYVLAALTQDANFARQFFDRYIYGNDLPDFAALFADFGVEMKPKDSEAPYLGIDRFRFSPEGAEIRQIVAKGTPAYSAGMNRGDLIVTLNGISVTDPESWEQALKGLERGKSYPISYSQLGERIESHISPQSNPQVVLRWLPDSDLSQEVIQRRNNWVQLE